jgi:hypothetical protein
MFKLNARRSAAVLGIALVALALAAAAPSSSSSSSEVPGPAPLASPAEQGACQDGETLFSTSPVPETLFSTEPAPGSSFEPATPHCKACKDQPFCGCTYQGHPRISCDPCCYAAFPAPICLS